MKAISSFNACHQNKCLPHNLVRILHHGSGAAFDPWQELCVADSPILETMRDDETAVGLYRRAGVDDYDEGCHEDDLWLCRDEAGDRCCVVGAAQQVR